MPPRPATLAACWPSSEERDEVASSYGYNFGFRRSGVPEAVREGRFRVPATGTFFQGDLVEPDPAAPGYIKHSANHAKVEPGFRGLLIQEDTGIDYGIHENQVFESMDLASVRNGSLCAIWTGAGLKIWLKNTAQVVRAGGRTRAAREVVASAASVAVGDYLEWTGTEWAETATAANQSLHVTAANGVDYVEAVLMA
jgi:hypothetical protein